jgi:hypothetical protein
MFSKTLVQAIATQYKAPEDILNLHCRESIPDDSGLPILTVYLFGEAK